jgi:uncharacterized protein (TIGR02421 family)
MSDRNETSARQQQIIADLSERLIKIQKPIRILDSIKWDDAIRHEFFAKHCKELPHVTKEYYQQKPLGFVVADKVKELQDLEFHIQSQLGKMSPLSQLMQRNCHEYQLVLRMLEARGTSDFGECARQLYGSSTDAFYVGGPDLTNLATLLNAALPSLLLQTESEADRKRHTGTEAAAILQERLATYFNDPNEPITVEVSDDMVADAAAGAEVLRIKRSALFSDRDIRILEVHEGWVHLGTTMNGRRQPCCSFLSKGTPSSTITQEGLALITEVFTFSASPLRIKRICDRITSVNMAEKGANFIEVFNYLREQGHMDAEAYALATRVFRGSLTDGSCSPFTKDVSYSKGFVLIYNYIRLAVKHGLIDRVPLLFVGKATLEDMPLFADLLEQGLLEYPKYMPPQFRDLAALSCWFSFSLFMNKINLEQLEIDFKGILRI